MANNTIADMANGMNITGAWNGTSFSGSVTGNVITGAMSGITIDSLKLAGIHDTGDGICTPIDAHTVSRFFPDMVRYEKKRLRRKLGWEGLLLLAGVQSGIVRHVRALGLEPFDLYQVHISWKNGQRTRYFTVDPGFRFAAEEQGWPPKFLREALGT